VAQLAGNADIAAMRGDKRFGNRKAHAGTADEVALIAATVKFVEDQTLLKGIDAGAMVGHAEADKITYIFRGDSDGAILGRVEMSIVDELDEDIGGALGIGADVGKVGVDI
jgi:hypothetical protein